VSEKSPDKIAQRYIAIIAWIAIVFGVLLAIGEVIRNIGDWQWWPFWVVDMICSALLIAGGWYAQRPVPQQRLSLLVGALGFCTAMGYASFFSHLANIDGPVEGNIAHLPLTITIGVLFAMAAICFATSVRLAMRLESARE